MGSPGSAQLPATACRTADRTPAEPLTDGAGSRRVLAVAALFAGLWALFTIIAGPASAADDELGTTLPSDPYSVDTSSGGVPAEDGELPDVQATTPSQEPLPDTPVATSEPDGSEQAPPSTSTTEQLPAGTPGDSPSPPSEE